MSNFELRRPHGPRDPNDGWADGPAGRFWGRGGAAGLLVHDHDRGILLQHRVAWSDQGGTWGLPGGARHQRETALAAALREAKEEAGVPADAVSVRFSHTFDVGYWAYTTVGTEVIEPFEAEITDPESMELRWVLPDDVSDLPLHPGFGQAWPGLHDRLRRPATLVVDAANVVGSRPDGWWNDRAGATERLLQQLATLYADGAPGEWFGLDRIWRFWPETIVVVEGEATRVTAPSEGRTCVVPAPRDGDATVFDQVTRKSDTDVTVVTSDRELQGRVEQAGARVLGAGTLLAHLEASR